jgi:3-deoxy-D-manno-octulosonic-acid transferase
MHLLYSLLLGAALVVTLPYWLLLILLRGRYRAGLRERLGSVPARVIQDDPHGCVWVHAVSVGEVLAVSGLVERLRQQSPARRVLVSTTTQTGQELARLRFGEENVFYFPLDFSFAVRPYLRALRPALVVLAETEFWPNFLRMTREYGTRIAVVNARISDRSFPSYRRWRGMLRHVLENVDVFLAQADEDARRLREIGAAPERVRVSGNLKFDVKVSATPEWMRGLSAALGHPVLVCGSTVEGEEEALLSAFGAFLEKYPEATMVLAPRHPPRFEGVAAKVERSGLKMWRRSQWQGQRAGGGVFLLDTLGELAATYGVADVAFVGGSLVPLGGHNILEPAQHGVPIIVGPHMENFRAIREAFQQADALRIATLDDLSRAFLTLLGDENLRRELGQRAQQVFRSQAGATERTVAALAELLLTVSSASKERR